METDRTELGDIGGANGFVVDGSSFAGFAYVEFDEVTLSGSLQNTLTVDIWLSAGEWEEDSIVRAWVTVDDTLQLPVLPGCVDALNASATVTGQWISLTADLSSYRTAQLTGACTINRPLITMHD